MLVLARPDISNGNYDSVFLRIQRRHKHVTDDNNDFDSRGKVIELAII